MKNAARIEFIKKYALNLSNCCGFSFRGENEPALKQCSIHFKWKNTTVITPEDNRWAKAWHTYLCPVKKS